MKIEIQLADQDVGTVAIVSRRRWLFKVQRKKYTCTRVDRMHGAYWFDDDGVEAPAALSDAMSLTAQMRAFAKCLADQYPVTSSTSPPGTPLT